MMLEKVRGLMVLQVPVPKISFPLWPLFALSGWAALAVKKVGAWRNCVREEDNGKGQ
jgi:hypothetical protein